MASATELVSRSTENHGGTLPPLENGERLDQKSFHARYEQMPKRVKAELVGGRVFIMASPLHPRHGRPHGDIVTWLGTYKAETPGTDMLDNTTTILGDDSELQPDACMLILPEFGGQTRENDKGWLEGTPELVVEVASSSQSYDLHEKREDYEKYGVKEYVVYAASQKRVYWWVRRDGQFAELAAGTDGIFRSETFPGLWLDPTALAQSDSARILAVLRQGLAAPEHAAFVADLKSRRSDT